MQIMPPQTQAHQPTTFFSFIKNSCIKTAIITAAVCFSMSAPFVTTTATITAAISDRTVKKLAHQAGMPHVFTKIFQTAFGIGSSRLVLMTYFDFPYQNNEAVAAATTAACGFYLLQKGFMRICNKYFELD